MDDADAKIIGLRYCNNGGGLLFKGFQAKFSSANGPVVQTYGTVNDVAAGAINCVPSSLGDFEDVTEEIRKYAVYVDTNDVEGLRFVTESGLIHVIKANFPIFTPDPERNLKGRPIGFKIELGHTAVDALNTPNQLMQVQLIYNSCMCPDSQYLANRAP